MQVLNQHCPRSHTKHIGLFGGSFDPIHYGHLRSAYEALCKLKLDTIHFIPTHTPAHKKALSTDKQHNLAMTQLATANIKQFYTNDIEFHLPKPNYTLTTIQHLRTNFGEHINLYLLIGMDAYLSLTNWYRWQSILDYTHIIILKRITNRYLSPELDHFAQQHCCDCPEKLIDKPKGLIYQINTTLLDISSSQIRNQLSKGLNPHFLSPEVVLNYIRKHKLYNCKN